MILVWLGSLMLVLFGLHESQNSLRSIFSRWQISRLDQFKEGQRSRNFILSMLFSVSEASPKSSSYAGLGFYNLRILSREPSLLLMVMSPLSAWWALFVATLFLKFQGLFLIAIAGLGAASLFNQGLLKSVWRTFFALGIFLFAGESLLRQSAMLPMFLGESPIAFWLADGRSTALLGLLLLGILVGLVIQTEFWSLCLGIGLLMASSISFNGALAVFAGERIAQALLFAWRSRKLDEDGQKVGRSFALVSALAAVIGLIASWFVRDFYELGKSFGADGMQERSLSFILLLALILLIQWLALLVWGHWAQHSFVPREGIFQPRYFPASWFQREFISLHSLQWAKARVWKRLQEIRYHLHGLSTYQPGQIPDHVQSKLKNEEASLGLLYESMK